jgi:hypothetical protein
MELPGHANPHPPQLAALVFVSTQVASVVVPQQTDEPVHTVAVPHWQTLLTHRFAFARQATPHPLQCATLLVVSTQTPEQTVPVHGGASAGASGLAPSIGEDVSVVASRDASEPVSEAGEPSLPEVPSRWPWSAALSVPVSTTGCDWSWPASPGVPTN